MDQIEMAQKISECENSPTLTRSAFLSRPFAGIPVGSTRPVDYAAAYRTCMSRYNDASRCESIFQQSKKEFCKGKIEKEAANGVVRPLPELPMEDNLEYAKKRKIAQAQSSQAAIANAQIDLKNQALNQTRLLASSTALLAGQSAIGQAASVISQATSVLALLDRLRKPRTKVKDSKIKAKADAARERKQVEEERQNLSRSNVDKAVEAYTYPITPLPERPVASLPASVAPTPQPTPVNQPFPWSDPPQEPVKYFAELEGKQKRNLGSVLFWISFPANEQRGEPAETRGSILSRQSFTGTTQEVIQQATELIRTRGVDGEPPQPDFVWPGGP